MFKNIHYKLVKQIFQPKKENVFSTSSLDM